MSQTPPNANPNWQAGPAAGQGGVPPQQQYQQHPYPQQGVPSDQPQPQPKPKKPIWKRWWFILIAVIIVLGVIGSIGGGSGSSSSSSGNDSSGTVESKTADSASAVDSSAASTAAAAEAAGAATSDADVKADNHTLKFEVTSNSATTADITITSLDANGNISQQQLADQALPFSKTVEVDGSVALDMSNANIMAQAKDGTDISASVAIDDNAPVTSTGSGQYATAFAQGSN